MAIYGIYFKHPRTRKRGYDLSNDMYINIEVVDHNNIYESDPDALKDFLNQHYNSAEKLFKLQSYGTIFDLKETPENSDTELSRFRRRNSGAKFITNEDLHDFSHDGTLFYYAEFKNQPSDKLEVDLCTNKFEEIKECSLDYDWKYAFIFDENTKKFSYIKIY